jgi:hypothetical protein
MRSPTDGALARRDLTDLPAGERGRGASRTAFRLSGTTLEPLALSIGALALALALFGAFVRLGGRDPLAVYSALYVGAFGTRFSIEGTLTQAAPIILTALCTALPARVGLLVIGGEGALVLGGLFAVLAATAAGAARELPFIMGQIMIFRREALAAIGGVESADGQLVDDMYLGKRMAEAGWHNVMSDRPLHIVTGDMSLADFVRLMRRWLLFSRSGLPMQFKRPAWLRGVAMWAAMIAAVAAIAHGLALATVLAVAALAAACLSDRALHRQLGGAPMPLRFFPMTLAVMLLAPLVLASMVFDRHVDWRGRDYALDNGSHLKSDSSAALPRG